MNLLKRLFSSDGFMPHGHCYFWNPSVLRLHIISDALITAAYLTIPITLVYIVRKRKDVPFDWIFACFGIFIVACGVTHAMEIWSIWHPTYWLTGSLKALTAAASAATAALLMKLVPKILAIPSPDILRQANRALENEIVERKRTEEAIRQLQRSHELIFSSIAEGIHWIDRNGRIVFENPAAARMLGWESADLIGQPAHLTMHHTRADGTPYPQCECHIYTGLRTGVARRVDDEVFWRKDGTSFPVEYATTPVRDENGEIIGAVVVFTDITERKQAEDAQKQFAADLLRERQRLDEILNGVPGVVFEHHVAGDRTDYVSSYIEKMLGYSREEWLSTKDFWFSRVHPEDRERVAANAAEVFAGCSTKAIVFRWLARDGRLVWNETHLVHLRDEAGQILGVRGFTLDVTERRQAEEELRWKTALLEAQINSSLDGILVVDDHGKKILQNRQFGDLWKIPQEILDEHDDTATLQYAADSTLHPERFYKRVMYLYAHPDETALDEIEFKDGRILDRYSSPVLGKDGKSYGRIWMFRDITERKRAEADLVGLNKQLVEVSRQAGMAEVATSVLHNVGNVLNSVNVSLAVASEKTGKLKIASLGRLAAMLREHADDLPKFFASHPQGMHLPAFLTQLAEHFAAEQQTLLAELGSLHSNVEHINEIVAMQQSYAGTGGVIETLSLANVIDDALRMNAAALDRHGARVVRELDATLPPIEADRHKLLLILANLIRNANHACDDAGHADKRITVRAHLNGTGMARISVSDNGIGIPPENLTRIFAHGFTTRKSGHGFGLHSSALAASEMGGSLRAHSDGPGHGATFTIELPLTLPPTLSR